MQTFYFTSLAALLSFTTAYNIASGSSPSGNDISAPAPGAQIPAGKSFTIRWSPSAPTTNDLSLILVEGSSSNPSSMQSKFTIADNVPNTGSYTWNVDGSVTPATDYAVLLVVGGTQSYQLSSNFAVGPVGSTASGGNSNSNSGSSSPSGSFTTSASKASGTTAAPSQYSGPAAVSTSSAKQANGATATAVSKISMAAAALFAALAF